MNGQMTETAKEFFIIKYANMVDKKIVVKAIIEQAKNDSQETKIMTSLVEGYERPERIGIKGAKKRDYTPDVLLRHDHAIELYTVELGKQNDYELDKWRAFSLYTQKEKGNFNIVIPEENLVRLRGLLAENNIKAKILYFS
jgi:hypothetical protein